MDTLLRGGRVIDPGTGFDAVTDILISDGSITAVGADAGHSSPDARVVDVTGKIVGPGFVDLHSHVNSIVGQRMQAMDGVTTALELEAGLMPIEKAITKAQAEGRPTNFGFSASWAQARAVAHLGIDADPSLLGSLTLLGNPEWERTSSAAERHIWLGLLEDELSAGALGIGVLLGYAPETDPSEFLDVARIAKAAGTPVYTHVRELTEVNPETLIDGSYEIVRAAGETGASMHHCHVNSTSTRHIDRVLGLFDDARAAGSSVTVEAYPYGAGSTGVGAFFLAPHRLAGLGITPSRIVMVESGERISDARRLTEIRESDPGATCIVEFLDEQDANELALLERGLIYPDSIVASDAMPTLWQRPDGTGYSDTREWPPPAGGRTHPRTSGTFAKSIRRMVRETGVWTWPEAFRRCAYLPARLLDETAPSMRRKGHLGIGADADIVVIDPDTFSETSSFDDPTRSSIGVRHLFVHGTPVITDGELQVDAYPGRAIRGEAA